MYQIKNSLFVLIILLASSLLWITDSSAQLALTASEQAWLIEHPLIHARVGKFPPYHFWDDGPQGISVELLDRIAAMAGFQVHYLHGIPWAEALNSIRTEGNIDLLLTAKPTKERQDFLAFSNDYLHLQWVIFTRRTITDIKTLAHLQDKTITIEKGYALQKQLAAEFPQIQQILFDNTAEALLAVSQAQADAYVGNLTVGQYYIGQLKLNNLKVAAPANIGIHNQAFAARKSWAPLASILSKGLAAISRQERNAIDRNYFSLKVETTDTRNTPLTLTRQEDVYIQGLKLRRARTEKEAASFSFIQHEGETTSLNEAYWHLVRDKLGLKEQVLMPMSSTQILQGIQQGTIDLYPTTTHIAQYDNDILFTDAYEQSSIAIATHRNTAFIATAAALEGEVVAVGRNYGIDQLLRDPYPSIYFMQVEHTLAALEAVESGHAFAAVDSLPVLQYQIEQFASDNIRLAGVTDIEFKWHMMVSKQYAPLVPLLNRAIAAITPEERLTIHKRWMLHKVVTSVDYSLLWQLTGGALLIILLILYWNRKLAIAQAQLTLANARLQAIFSNTNAAIATFKQRTFLEVNDYLAELMGYQAKDLIGQSTRIVHLDSEHYQRFGERLYPQLAKKRHSTIEYPFRHHDGHTVWMYLSISTLTPQSSSDEIALVGVDISARRQMEQTLRQERTTAQRYLDTVQTLMVALDSRGHITMLNRAGCALLDYRLEDILNCNWFATCLPQPEGWEVQYPRFRQIMNGTQEENRYLESTVLCRNGNQRLIAWHNSYFHDGKHMTGVLCSGEDITERKCAEQALRDSHARYQSLVEDIGPNFVIYSRRENGILEYASKGFETVFGIPAKEAIGKNFFKLINWDSGSLQQALSNAAHKHRTGKHIVQEIKFRHPDRGMRTILVTSHPTRNPNSQSLQIEGIVEDISKRKQTEQALITAKEALEASNRAHKLIGLVRHAVIHANTEQQLLTKICKLIINQECFRFAWIGRKKSKLQHSMQSITSAGLDDGDLQIQKQGLAEKISRTGQKIVVQDIFTEPDCLPWHETARQQGYRSILGLPLIVEEAVWGGIFIYADKTEIFSIAEIELLEGLASDVSFGMQTLQLRRQRRLTVRKLRESQNQLALTLKAANLGVWDWWPQRNYLTTNDIFLTMLGYSADTDPPDTTQDWLAFIHPDELLLMQKQLQPYLDGDDHLYRSEHRLRAADGQWRWILSVGQVVMRDNEGKAERFVGVQIDISEQKKIEQQLLAARQAAETANQAKSAFLANMSHELRTPLNAVLGYSQILLNQPNLTAEQQHDLKAIRHAGDYLLLLISDILDLAKIEAGRFELLPMPSNLQAVFHQIGEQLGFRAQQKDINFKMKGLDSLPSEVEIDEKRLRQVIMNLLGNAIKFTEQGSVTLKLAYHQGELSVAVLDTGIGIAADQLDHLFTPYTQTGRKEYKREGTGLGLAISESLVKQMGGSIQVTSQLGQGSCFTFHIPAPILRKGQSISYHSDTSFAYPLGYQRTDSIGAPFQLLVVDDHAENRKILHGLLAPLGFRIQEADDGQAAIDSVEHQKPDLVLMDLVMPRLDGLAATRHLHSRHPTLPIIAISARAYQEDRAESAEAGCFFHITKPIKLEELLPLLQQFLPLTWQYAQNSQPDCSDSQNPNLDKLSQEQIDHLRDAVNFGNREHMQKMLSEITTVDNALADQLEQWMKGYEYQRILNLLNSKTH